MFDWDISRALQSKENWENKNSKKRIEKVSKKNMDSGPGIFAPGDYPRWSKVEIFLKEFHHCPKVKISGMFRESSEVTQGSMQSSG